MIRFECCPTKVPERPDGPWSARPFCDLCLMMGCYVQRGAHENPSTGFAVLRRRGWERHKVSEDQVREMYARQQGACAICRADFEFLYIGTFRIDHDYSHCRSQTSCGECVRGLLCNGCNTYLGKSGDTLTALKEQTLTLTDVPLRAQRAMVYLETYEARKPEPLPSPY